MNSNTKIIVIPKGVLVAAVCAIVIAVIVLIALILGSGSGSEVAPASGNNLKAAESGTEALSGIDTADSGNEDMFTPGVYTSSISLDGIPMSVKVTVDANNINSIDLVYSDESIPTMYPMLGTCFNELAKEVCDKGTTMNITYNAENRYTSSILLNGIQNALNKASK